MSTFSTCTLLLFSAVFVGLARFGRKTSRLPLPPGPKPLPLVGRNIFQFPTKETTKVLAQWRQLYGDIIYIHDIGEPILVLSSRKACTDLLEKRSAIYSDRPYSALFHELSDFGWEMGLMPHSEEWRVHRRLFHQYFNERTSQTYREYQETATHVLLGRLLQDPEGFLGHIRTNFVDSILQIVYGIPAGSYSDTFVKLAERVMKDTAECLAPTHPVNLLPILRYLPSWFPGAGFHKVAAEARVGSYNINIRQLPFEQAQEDMKSGLETSILRLMLEKCEGSDLFTVEVAKNCASNAYVAGADTTLSSIQALFLALANRPEVQKRAQAEIDSVTGLARLPTLSDMEDLPYLSAIVKEMLRWHNVVPLGVAHRLTQDDVYEGHAIPQGTIVLQNIWAILHDPETYPDPYTFNPSRWLIETAQGPKFNSKIPDPDSVVFGAGRRICPGRHFALNSLFITASNILACFDISPLDMEGKPIKFIPENMVDGMIVYPLPFKASIAPRSERAITLISEAVA